MVAGEIRAVIQCGTTLPTCGIALPQFASPQRSKILVNHQLSFGVQVAVIQLLFGKNEQLLRWQGEAE